MGSSRIAAPYHKHVRRWMLDHEAGHHRQARQERCRDKMGCNLNLRLLSEAEANVLPVCAKRTPCRPVLRDASARHIVADVIARLYSCVSGMQSRVERLQLCGGS